MNDLRIDPQWVVAAAAVVVVCTIVYMAYGAYTRR